MRSPRLQDSLHGLLTWFLDVRSHGLDLEGEHRPAAIAAHLACSYEAWEEDMASGREPVTKTGSPVSLEHYLRDDSEYRARVGELCRFIQWRLSPYLTHAYLHGSLSTEDYARGWSDVDTFIVIKQSVVASSVLLVELRSACFEAWPLFLSICPLQHHGFIVATEQDLSSYPSSYLPPAVIDTALSLLPGQQLLRFVPREGPPGAIRGLVERRDALRVAVESGVLRHHPKNGVYLHAAYGNAENGMVQLFSLLGYLMTVPTYVLDARGQACYKRESFVLARGFFSEEAWSVVERATAIRARWPELEGVTYAGNAIPAWIRDMLGPDYFEDALRLLEEAVIAVTSSEGSAGERGEKG
jgi:hypothetical protein